MSHSPKISVATIDPSQVGGVTTMTEYFCNMAKQDGFEPFISFFPLDPDLSIRLKNIVNWRDIRRFIEGNYLNFKSYSIGSILSEFEFLHYLSSYRLWKKVISEADICFAVSGTNQCCLPYVMAKKKFSCWIATTYFEDRKQNMISFTPMQKLLSIISLPLIAYFEGLIFKKAHKILVLSKYTKDMILKKYRITESKIIVAPSPIDTDIFSPYRNDHEGIRILFVGRINDPRKNVSMLMNAFSKLKNERDDVELWLVGEEPSENLKNLASQLNISENVKYFKDVPHDEIVNFYQSCDIFALPSYQEGLGIVVLEAMSCGLPVVSTRCGGPEWLLKDYANALVVENNNADKFADALKELIGDDNLRLKIGSEARKTVVNRCSVKTLEKIFIDVLDELRGNTRIL
jgi:glycosyltransferase involved in cell wall biosynthesis